MPSIRFKYFLPGIVWFVIVLILVCIPGENLPVAPHWFDLISFDKMIHAGLFGGIVFWFCLPFKKITLPIDEKLQWFLRITLATCVWGLTTELIQRYFIHNRQFDWVDWAADSLGAAIAFFLAKKVFV